MLELGMIPLERFVDLYRNSHFSQVYIYAYRYTDFRAARDYFYSAFEQDLRATGAPHCHTPACINVSP
ncbi:hypothetical protein B0H13DRAFT_2314396 [Mycena leptocephala]|nr:hypothetical protein B0H13DRAFT_2314396 [Mycena leptocephala]